jgi:LytR cell envelope-related transcriptional attenuator
LRFSVGSMSSLSSNRVNQPRRRPAERPLWLTVLLIFVAMLVLFGIGFGIATLLKGSGAGEPDTATSSSSDVINPGNCTVIDVTPAEVLPRASQVTVNVYNSTQRVGLAGDTAKLLGVRGFKVGAVENDPLGVPIEGVGEIRYGPKGEAGAQLIAYHFPGATLVDDGRKGKKVDISLGRQFVELANDAEVVALLAEPSPSPSPEGCVLPTPTPNTAESPAL